MALETYVTCASYSHDVNLVTCKSEWIPLAPTVPFTEACDAVWE